MKKTTGKELLIRFRLDFDGFCSIGRGKVQLLEGIERSGSLSQAARDMDMSYRRAWLLLDSMNNSFDTPVAGTSAGGKNGGGAVLTEFGKELIAMYRQLEAEMTAVARQRVRAIEKHVLAGKPALRSAGAAAAARGKSLVRRESRH